MTVTVDLPKELEQKISSIPQENRNEFFLNSIEGGLKLLEYQENRKNRYSPKVERIVANAMREAEELKKQGITRDEAFDMLDKSMTAISKRLNKKSGK